MADVLLVVGGAWGSIALLRAFLRSKPPLRSYLEACGITVTNSQVKWYWTGARSLFEPPAKAHPQAFARWFSAGAVLGVALMFLSVMVLSYTLWQTVRPWVSAPRAAGEADADAAFLVPVVPGVNLPLSQLGYYFFAIAVSAIVHEAGHGIAAVCEGVPVRGFGVFVYVLYPGAFVDLSGDEMSTAPLFRQLRIYCAGVWHNTVLVAVCLLAVLLLPQLLLPAYSRPSDAIVVGHVDSASPLYGSLVPGMHVTAIDDCVVTDTASWLTCLGESAADRSASRGGGFCVPRAMIEAVPRGAPQCCDKDSADALSSTSLCFERRPVDEAMCLPVRPVVGHTSCNVDDDCRSPSDIDDDIVQHIESSCMHVRRMFPYERFMRLSVKESPVVLYIGDPRVVAQTVFVTIIFVRLFSRQFNLPAVNVTPYAARLSLWPAWFPAVLERTLMYLVSLSGALALLNAVPAFLLDGQWIVFTLVDMCTPTHMPVEQRGRIANAVLYSGTALFGATVVTSLIALAIGR